MESRKIFPLTVIFMKEYFNIYNLEGSQKITVLEVAKGLRDVIGEHVKIEFVPERPGDFGGKEVTGKKAWQELAGSLKWSLRKVCDLLSDGSAKNGANKK